MYENIEKWLNGILTQKVPDKVVALNFNLYDDGDYNWSMELIGEGSFNLENLEWSYDEIFDFGTKDNHFSWKKEGTWQDVLEETTQDIKTYLTRGLYSDALVKYRGIGIGFVDDDVDILYVRQ